MYWASGCLHGPHHVMKEWADKYAGKFDDGWDAYRERAVRRAKEKGWIPQDAELTPRDPQMPAWDDIPEEQRPFQRRLMEVAAGFAEHVDVQVGPDARRDRARWATATTRWCSTSGVTTARRARGRTARSASCSPRTASRRPSTCTSPRSTSSAGSTCSGTPKADNQYHAGWAWAGSTPYKGMKLLASHLGGTRNPMAVRWPAKIAPDPTPRTQFHHCNDVVPTIYEVVGITPPRVVNGVPQDPIDGVSFAYAFDDPDAEGRLRTQYFEIMGSRAIYHDGWMASAFGPRAALGARAAARDPRMDTRRRHLGAVPPRRGLVAGPRPRRRDAREAGAAAGDLPDRGRHATASTRSAAACGSRSCTPSCGSPRPTREWDFSGDIIRMPEFCAPALGNQANIVTIDARHPGRRQPACSTRSAPTGGGLTCFIDDGILCYEYNLFIISAPRSAPTNKLPGRHGDDRGRHRVRRAPTRRARSTSP